MTRKNQWLPSQDIEPGSRTDYRTYNIGQVKSPLGLLGYAAGIIVGLIILNAVLLSMPNLNGPAITIIVIVDLAMLGFALFNAIRGTRRWIWRKKNINLTGGVYLRPWERTKPTQNR